MDRDGTDFFISYTRADESWARWLDWQLRDAGYSTVVQVYDFRPGSNFVADMDRASKRARRTMAVLSPDYLRSMYAQPEWHAAFARDPTGEKGLLVPVRVRECELAGLLAPIVYIDLVQAGGDAEAAREMLLEGLRNDARPVVEPAFPGAAEAGSEAPAPRFPGALPPVWNVPHRRNPHFTGRAELLEALEALLASDRPAALTQTIRGLGGVGKTQLALEYVYRHAVRYEVVWWVAAEEPATLRRDLAALAAELGAVAPTEADDEASAVRAARRWLERNRGWILVFDNAADPAELRELLPRAATGHVLITSRRSDWGRIGVLDVDPFERPESVRFLEQRVAAPAPDAGELADVLGDLPLALEQAAAYVTETSLSAREYLELFRERRQDLLARGRSEDYPETVATTWEISFRQLETAAPAAAGLLTLCAFLAPDDVPRDLFEPLGEGAADPIALLDAIGAARRLSLLETEGDALSMHRLLQAVARDRCDAEEREQWSGTALRLVNRAFQYDEDDLATWPRAGRLLPHALVVTRHFDDAKAPEGTARLLNDAGLYLLHRGQLATAFELLQRSLAIDEAAHGPDHPNVALRANNVAAILKHQGDLDGALKHARRALAIGEATYGPDHPTVALRANTIAAILHAQGDLDGALEHARRALAIDEAAYGPDHPTVATGANNVGMILKAQGDLGGALEHARRALAIDEAVHGPDHPTVATGANNVGQILQDRGDLNDALEHARRALAIDEAVYGPDHPTVARDANNIATIFRDQGDLDGALPWIERAHAILVTVFGPDHPQTQTAAGNLEMVKRDIEASKHPEKRSADDGADGG